jgi:hypothetical protein
VRVTVYDMLGRQVARLVDADLAAGRHEAKLDGSELPSGMYFYRIETPAATASGKMVKVR